MQEVILIDETSPLELTFNQGGMVIVHDETNPSQLLQRKVTISNNTRLTWYGVVSGNSDYSLQFVTESGESIVRILLLATQDEKLKTNIYSTLVNSHTVTNIHILSLVGESGIIELNGTVHIDSNIAQVKGHILEENIFLGSKGGIRGIPSLLVHSDDVEAGHAARIERVSDEKLYYLRSRGIPKDDATVMMVESSVAGLFE
ncbi:SufD family Fe-S cluster assembly protein [Candidatus Peribacteria bacterium]|nr:SufD family Fe-S cluster assembly protein [Candidatus Peribacteria bacterium]